MIRHLLLSLLLFAATGLVARQIFIFARDRTVLGHNTWATRRAAEMMQVLDKLDPSANPQRILFLGSSDTLLGVRALDIENTLNTQLKAGQPPWQVLNLAFLGLDSRAAALFIRRWQETPAGRAGGLHSVYIGFQPMFYTQRFRRMRQRSAAAFSFEMKLYSDQMLKSDFWQNPAFGLRVFVTAKLFDGITPGEARRSVSDLFFSPAKRREPLDRVWDFDGPGLTGFDWERRGHFYFDATGVDPRSRSLAEDFSPIRKAWRKQIERAYDGLELNLDAELLTELEENIRLLKAGAQNVVLFALNDCPDLGIKPEARENGRRALMSLQQNTGASAVQLSGYTCDDYFDMIHLNPAGQKKLAQDLADVIQKRR